MIKFELDPEKLNWNDLSSLARISAKAGIARQSTELGDEVRRRYFKTVAELESRQLRRVAKAALAKQRKN